MWMLIVQVVLLGLSLSMDAFAVSITDGMCYGDLNRRKAVAISLTFGVFQAVMPLCGYFLGSLFYAYIDAFDHFVAFGLLVIIGGKMVLDGIKELRSGEGEVTIKKFTYPEVAVQGVATSIDALAVGLSMLAMEGIDKFNIFGCVGIIGVITFCLSIVGIIIGTRIGKLFKNKASIAEVIGGLVLIAIGLKILIEGVIA